MRLVLSSLVALLLAVPGIARADEKDALTPEGIGETLERIADLMKEVEGRLGEAELDAYTEDEQRRIVEAMKFGDKARRALDDLIEKLEKAGDGT